MKNVKLGVIGVGRIGKLHVENLMSLPHAVVKTVSDIQVDHLKEWAATVGVENITTNYRDILDDKEIDAVLICSPTNTHYEVIIEAAKAGKHIFCEKPISFSSEESKEALKIVEESGIKFQVGFNRRFDASLKKVHDTVKKGIIGDPHIVKITSRDPDAPPADYIKNSGGMFMDMSIHDFDMARFITGSEVTEVYVQSASLIDPVFTEYGDVDTAIISLKFASGAIGVIDNSRKAVYGYDQRVEVFGSKGSVAIENELPTTAVISTAEGVLKDNPKYFFLERYREAYIVELACFIDSVANDAPLVCSGNDGLQAEIIAAAAKKSMLTGEPVKIEHDKSFSRIG